MADGISFDFSELNTLAAVFEKVPLEAAPLVKSAVQFTATLIKKESAKSVGRKRWSAAAAAIDYDIKPSGHGVEAEIGYNKGKAGGPLGNIREFGSPGQNTAPSNDLLNALHNNEADFQKGLGIALEQGEKKAGL